MLFNWGQKEHLACKKKKASCCWESRSYCVYFITRKSYAKCSKSGLKV